MLADLKRKHRYWMDNIFWPGLAFRLPSKLVYWATIRAFGEAWVQSRFKEPDELTYDEVVKPWHGHCFYPPSKEPVSSFPHPAYRPRQEYWRTPPYDTGTPIAKGEKS